MSRSIRVAVGSALASIPLSVVAVNESTAQDLQSFAVISGLSLTNTGATTITGNIAISPGASYTGSGSVTQTGETYLADAVAARMQNELATLYTALAGRPTSNGGNLTGQDLGGMTLTPGVYNFDTSAGLAAGEMLTLDAGGNPDAIFIFNIGSTFIAESGSSVVLVNEAQGGNVFYRIGSSATLHTSAEIEGQIVALTSITMNTSAKLACGAAMARNGSITLDGNTIQICTLAATGFDAVIDSPLLTESQRAVSAALSDFVAAGGVLPIGFAILAATQTPAELALSLSQLSGEVATGIAPMNLQSMNAFLDTVVKSGHKPRFQPRALRDQGVPVGLVPEKIDAAYAGKYGSDEPESEEQALSYPMTLAEQSRPWNVWASGYGSRNVTDGDTGRGLQERTSENRGLAAGLNFSPSASQDFGVAVSWNEADFSLANSFGTGTSDTLFVALRGRTATERAYVEGALAYGRSDIATTRNVTIAGVDQLVGETTADTFAAHVEAGYHMGIFTPFAGIRAQSTRTDAYSETAASGASSYALRYDESTTNSVRSELGVDMQWSTEHSSGGLTTVGLRAAWAHEFASNGPDTRSFAAVPGVTFPATGVTRDRDSLILAASVGMSARNGIYVDGAVSTEYSDNAQDLGGSITLGYRW